MVRLALVFSSLIGLSLCSSAYAQTGQELTNGGFESGFDTWQTIDDTSIETRASGVTPIAGNNQALLRSGNADNITSIEEFFNLRPGAFTQLGKGEPFGGSAIKHFAINANAGDTFRFSWNFLTNEARASTNNDFAFVVIQNTPEILADTNSRLRTSNTVFTSETGYQQFSRVVPTSGSYTVGFGVVNVGDGEVGSGLFVDQAEVIPVPESIPAGAMASAVGLGFVVFQTRRRARVRK